jgi:hypothetical protein
MIVMSAGLNAGMTALPNRDFEVSPSDTPNRDLDGIASRVMKIGPEESILRKKQVSPHKIGEHCRGSPRHWNSVLRSRHHAQRPDDCIPRRVRGGHCLWFTHPDLGIFLSSHARPAAKMPVAGPPSCLARSSSETAPSSTPLADAAQFILGLHEVYQDRNSWRRASELLMEAAERGGSIEAATEQFELALFLEARYVRQ